MSDTKIEWATKVWNPTTGCTKVTAGCLNCYAETIDRRFHAKLYGRPHVPWTVKAQRQAAEYADKHANAPMGLHTFAAPPDERRVLLHPDRLYQPLRWKQPKDGSRHRVFVDSMSDLFHEGIPEEFIARVWATMAATPQHDYLILTKRPERAAGWATEYYRREFEWPDGTAYREGWAAPWPNVWIGVSVTGKSETTGFLDALTRIPAAVRFVSYEPALAPFDFGPWLLGEDPWDEMTPYGDVVSHGGEDSCIDWLIVGGESGAGARPFNVAWAERTIEQCQEADVPVFFKQAGSKPYVCFDDSTDRWESYGWPIGGNPPGTQRYPVNLRDAKGGDPDEWPEALRVREFPEVTP